MTICQECGMACDPAEYHPFAACLMFKACHDGDVVRANLQAVAGDARSNPRLAFPSDAAWQYYLAVQRNISRPQDTSNDPPFQF